MIKLKLFEILDAKEPIIKLMNCELPVKTAYKLSKMAVKLQAELNVIEDNKKKIYELLGEKTNEGISIPKDKVPEFQLKMNELLQVEVELDIELIKLSEIESAKITPMQLTAITKLLEEK